MDTICKECIFAQWDNENRQIGCAAKQLEKFEEKGVELEPAQSDGKVYACIKNRICLMLRTKEWAGTKNTDLKKLIKIARREISLQCEAYLFLDTHTFEEAKKTFKSLVKQKLKPSKVVIVLNHKYLHPARITRWLRSEYENFPWQVSKIHAENVSREWCIDHVTARCEAPYYALFESGFEPPDTFFESIDKYLNDDLNRFAILLPENNSINGCVVNTSIHQSFEGNLPQTIMLDDNTQVDVSNLIEKLQFFSKQQKAEHLIKKVNDICYLG